MGAQDSPQNNILGVVLAHTPCSQAGPLVVLPLLHSRPVSDQVAGTGLPQERDLIPAFYS